MSKRIESIFGIIFTDDKKQVLLIKRRDVPLWVFPGGGVENNETPEEATIREIQEETGLNVTIDRKVATYLPSKPFIKRTNLYACKIKSGSLKTSDEVQDVQFFPLSDFSKKIMPPPFHEFLADALKNTSPIERQITSLTPFFIAKILITHPILSARFILSRVGLHINS